MWYFLYKVYKFLFIPCEMLFLCLPKHDEMRAMSRDSVGNHADSDTMASKMICRKGFVVIG